MLKEEKADIHLLLSSSSDSFIAIKQHWQCHTHKRAPSKTVLFAFKRKQAGAVERNRIKRICREYFRLNIPARTIVISITARRLNKGQLKHLCIRQSLYYAIERNKRVLTQPYHHKSK